MYIEIDPDQKIVRADYNGEIGNAIPFPVYYGTVLRYTIRCIPTTQAINELMAGLTPLFARIVDGYRDKWIDANRYGFLKDKHRRRILLNLFRS